MSEERHHSRRYTELLKSGYWHNHIRPQVFHRENGKCQGPCGQDLHGKPYQIHHVSYVDDDGNDVIGREHENLHLLMLTCPACHPQLDEDRKKLTRKLWNRHLSISELMVLSKKICRSQF